MIRRLLLPLLAVAAIGTAACTPVILPPGGGSGPCYVGSFNLASTQILAPLNTTLGPITIAPLPGGSVTLNTTTSTWALSVSPQSFSVSAPGLSGTAVVNATASGTLTGTATTLTFGLTSLTGSVTFNGTFQGSPVSQTFTIKDIGMNELYGFTGTANYTCGKAGPTITFTSAIWDF